MKKVINCIRWAVAAPIFLMMLPFAVVAILLYLMFSFISPD